MTITKAQDELLRKLENGSAVTFTNDYYVVFSEEESEKIWPSTFYGLYDTKMVEKDGVGNYTISGYGKQQIRSKKK